MHILGYVCTPARTYEFVYISMCAHTHTYTHMYTCGHTYIHTHKHRVSVFPTWGVGLFLSRAWGLCFTRIRSLVRGVIRAEFRVLRFRVAGFRA